MSPRVLLRGEQSELRAGAPRDVPSISGVVSENVLDDVNLPVGLGERGAARA